jgi:hypothetical protein
MNDRLCERHFAEYPLKEGETVKALKVSPERCDMCKAEVRQAMQVAKV